MPNCVHDNGVGLLQKVRQLWSYSEPRRNLTLLMSSFCANEPAPRVVLQMQGGGQQAQQAGRDFVQSGASNVQAAAEQVFTRISHNGNHLAALSCFGDTQCGNTSAYATAYRIQHSCPSLTSQIRSAALIQKEHCFYDGTPHGPVLDGSFDWSAAMFSCNPAVSYNASQVEVIANEAQ